jgi:hypothetical protein
MNEHARTCRLLRPALWALTLASAACTYAAGQVNSTSASNFWGDPILPRDLGFGATNTSADSPAAARAARVRLFRMPPPFSTNPSGLEADGENSTGEANGSTAAESGGSQENWLQVSMGADNPFFDFRRPGDPGGVGFYKLHSQVRLFETPSLGLCVGIQAVTPAGAEAEGLVDGPTTLSPNLAWSYEVTDIGAALHGFVGANVRAKGGWTDELDRDIHCGVALHSPVPGLVRDANRSIHLFVEALGRLRPDLDSSQRATPIWELLPGIHCRLGDSWWMSGGLLMPLYAPRPDNRLWQITCSWQF